MMPAPSTITRVRALTITSMPPMTVFAVMTTSGLVKTASRRSMSMPPMTANAVCDGPTSHTPLRSTPVSTAYDDS